MSELEPIPALSASRIGTANRCGLAYKYQYVDRIPALQESASRLFGHVIHDGVAEWYGEGLTTEANIHRHKDLSLEKIVAAQWKEKLPPKIWEALQGVIEADKEREATASLILMQRPTLKKPMNTKAFLESSASKNFIEKQLALRELADKMNDIKWPQSTDPFTEYSKSRMVARIMEMEWKPQPRPIMVEEAFHMELEGFVVRGRIDQVRQDLDLGTGELMDPIVLDIKSGKQPLTQMEAFLQAYLYSEACRQNPDLPTTNKVDFYLCRHVDERGQIKVQRGSIDPDRHKRLALRILKSVGTKIQHKEYGPHYGHWCKMCDYNELCSKEISLWDGDGIELEDTRDVGIA
jgi:CRISPR/Cas system-associated exonuclease Cas4 (RecB family)